MPLPYMVRAQRTPALARMEPHMYAYAWRSYAATCAPTLAAQPRMLARGTRFLVCTFAHRPAA
eukprot:3691637-Pyramimonas_sp.AAC.1